VAAAIRHRGAYAGSREELTPVRGDLRTALPVAAVVAVVVAHPPAGRWFAGSSVAGYALSPAGWDQLLAEFGSGVPDGSSNGCAIGSDDPVR
jgi:hypothetical protein